MDTDLLWISGGCWFLSGSSSMASSAASSSSATKLFSQAAVLMLFLLFVGLMSWSHIHHPLTSASASTIMSADVSYYFTESSSARKLLLLSSSSTHHHQPSFHPNQKMNPALFASPSHTAEKNSRSFRAAAHEVPSGPNPESN